VERPPTKNTTTLDQCGIQNGTALGVVCHKTTEAIATKAGERSFSNEQQRFDPVERKKGRNSFACCVTLTTTLGLKTKHVAFFASLKETAEVRTKGSHEVVLSY
jgi:hypothetical protein